MIQIASINFNNHKEVNICYKYQNHKSIKNIKNYSFIYYLENSFCYYTFIIIASTSSSVTLSVTGFALIVIPISTGIAYGLTLTIETFLIQS